jgi:FixJ family two-component response regulator
MISIVDDDRSVREAVESLVRSLGYSTASFASAEEYLGSGRVHDSECVITDVRMPGMTGLDLRERLLANGYYRPIILMSALSEKEATGASTAKTSDLLFLRKPLSDESLMHCLDRALENVAP